MWPLVSFTLNVMKQFMPVAQKSNNIFTKWLTVNQSWSYTWKYFREFWLFFPIPFCIDLFFFLRICLYYTFRKRTKTKRKKNDEIPNFPLRSETSSTVLVTYTEQEFKVQFSPTPLHMLKQSQRVCSMTCPASFDLSNLIFYFLFFSLCYWLLINFGWWNFTSWYYVTFPKFI